MKNWWIFTGTREPHDGISKLPMPPSWRTFGELDDSLYPTVTRQTSSYNEYRHLGSLARATHYQASEEEIDLVNAALYLRRPLFVTGKPGSGKSSLAFAVAHELNLGPVLHWMITTRVTLQDGLYHYDAIGRLQDSSLHSSTGSPIPDIGAYIRLGPLGTALTPTKYPRVLLIDEIDKSDIDLPNDLLNVFEEGEYVIPELARLTKETGEVKVMPFDGQSDEDRIVIRDGRVLCTSFPLIIMTSNNERDFPSAFLRRCLRLNMQQPSEEKLVHIIEAHLGAEVLGEAGKVIEDFIARRARGDLATDQLLNAIYLATRTGVDLHGSGNLMEALLRHIGSTEDE